MLAIKQRGLNPKIITNSRLPLNTDSSTLRNDKNLKANLGICCLHIKTHDATVVSLKFQYFFKGL